MRIHAKFVYAKPHTDQDGNECANQDTCGLDHVGIHSVAGDENDAIEWEGYFGIFSQNIEEILSIWNEGRYIDSTRSSCTVNDGVWMISVRLDATGSFQIHDWVQKKC